MTNDILISSFKDYLRSAFRDIRVADAQAFDEKDLPCLSVAMPSDPEPISLAIPTTKHAVIEITYEAHSGDDNTRDEVSAVTKQIEDKLKDNAALLSAMNTMGAALHFFMFSYHGGSSSWEKNVYRCVFRLETRFAYV